MQYWLVKSEPSVYSWERFVKDTKSGWEGVRNYAARLHLRAMAKGDKVLFYHSNEGLNIVGIAEVIRTAYQDPTTTEEWSTVDLRPVQTLQEPLSLNVIKKDPVLKEMKLVKIGRLSVSPVTETEFNRVLLLSGTTFVSG